jgi:glycosyltransferase involved in cell wall biosynthesis
MSISVLLIAPSMNIVGGQSIQADRLLKAFSSDAEVRLRLWSIDTRLPSVIRRIPYVRTFVNAPVYYSGLLKGIREADVVHAFTSSFWGYTLWVIPAIWLSRVFGRKVIVNYRDGRAESHLAGWRSAVATLKRVDAIIVPSRYLVEVFGTFGLRAEVVPNVIDLRSFRYRERRAVRPEFLTNRGLEPLYDVDCTLRAFRLIQDRYAQARFVVGNDGPLRGQLEALSAGLGLKNIAFTGAVSQTRMAEMYDAADIYVMSPRLDNMPGTVLECFASGLPIVSTAAGGVPHVAENDRNALLTPLRSPEALAGACFRLLEEPGLAFRLAKQGYSDCVERYSVDSVRQQWHDVYRRLTRAK